MCRVVRDGVSGAARQQLDVGAVLPAPSACANRRRAVYDAMALMVYRPTQQARGVYGPALDELMRLVDVGRILMAFGLDAPPPGLAPRPGAASRFLVP